MKKRLLSLLLLVAMILTMVPVMVSAEEAATESEQAQQQAEESGDELVPGDLHDWYIQDGLTALYSAFGANNGADLTNGTWANRVTDGESAALNGTYWTAGTDSIGYRLTYSEFKSDAASVSVTLPNSYAELDNFTVETLANMIGLTDENGDRYINTYVPAVKDENGDVVTPASGHQYGVFKSGYSTFRFDMMTALFFASYDSKTAAQSLTTRWYLMNGAYSGSTPDTTVDDNGYAALSVVHYETGWSVSASDEYKINVMQVTKATDYTGTETYAVGYNNVVKATKAMTAEQRAVIEAATGAEASRFVLFKGAPADVYSIRVYDRALTASELYQNHAVDVLLYYGIELDESVVANDAAKKVVLGAVGTFAIVTDASEKAAKKAELETLVKNALKNAKVLSLYAALDNLTSFYSVYANGTVDVAAGTWTDIVGGGNATMGTPSRWFLNADGSFGYNAFVGYVNGDAQAMGGNVNTDRDAIAALGNVPTANHAYYKNNPLTFGMSKLPTEDFTVEYMAMYRPYLVADAAKSTADKIVYATDTNGDLIEAYNLFGTTPATTDYGSIGGRAVDSIGHLTTITQRTDSTSGWGSSVRGTQHYLYGTHSWSQTRVWVGSGSFGATSGLAVQGDAYKQNNVINLYTITLDEATDAEGVVSGNFALYRNATLYNQSNGVLTGGTYKADFDSKCEFYLSCNQPTDFYAVRVYNKALTVAEQTQNRGADVLLYYGIELDEKTFADEELMAVIYAAVAGVDFVTDASEKEATKAQLNAIIADAANRLAALTLEGTLYVTEGLTSLFTAFAGTTQYTVDAEGANKVWFNRAKNAAANATFKGGDLWSIGANGGVGKIYIRGTMTDGTWSGTNANNTSITADYSLHFGLTLLPKDDFTVEYLAYFPQMYAEDTATGELVPHWKGTYTESGHVVDEIGFMEFCTVYPGGTFDSMNNYLRGRIADAGCTTWGGTTGGDTYGFGSVNFKINKRDTLMVDTYGLTRDETTVIDAETGDVTEQKASYVTLYNGMESHKYTNFSTASTSSRQGVYVSGTEMKDGLYYFGDDNTDFYLSKTAGATFYAVRIYDRVLTADERAQNRMADVLYYYGIALTAEQKANEELITYLKGMTAEIAIDPDASEYAAGKAALQATVSDFTKYQAYEKAIDTMYAAGENLTANYTTFVPGQYDLGAGTWTDRVNGATATLAIKAEWSAGEFGGIGTRGFYGMFDAEGAYVGSAASNTYNRNARLDFGIAQLPADDFTVEYVAMYKPLYVYDANEADGIARDESGNRIETYSQNNNTTGLFADKGSIDNLGWFQSITGQLDGQTYKDWQQGNSADATRGSVYWVFGQQNGNSSGWYATGAQTFWLGKDRIAAGGLHKLNDAYNTNNAIRTYAITVDETTTGEGEDAVTTAIFSLYRDGAFYNSNEAVNEINTSAKGFANGGYYVAGTEFDSKCRFWLAQNRPVDFFAVRIYDKTLTDAEKNQNHMLDLLMFYKLDLPMTILEDASLSAELSALLASVSFSTDPVAGAANVLMIEDAIESVQGMSKIYTLYAQEDLVANFTALSAKDMMASVDSGVWANRVAGAASANMGNKQYWRRNANGSVGFDIFYGSVDANGNYSTDSSYNNYAVKGTRLELGIGLLPKDDFTVEMVAQINPVYAADAYGNPAGETYLLNGNTPGSQQYGDHATTPIHQLGYFQAWTTNRDGVHGGFTARSAWVWTASVGTDWGTACHWHGMYGSAASALPIRGEVHTYTITREEGMADITDKNGEVQNVYNAEYTLRRDLGKFASQSFNSVMQAEKSGAAYTDMPDFTVDDTGYFYLSERVSTDFYAIRVYSRVLSAQEMQGNHLVDIILYYGLTFDEKLYDDTALFEAASAALSQAVIVTDASEKAANRALYQAKLDGVLENAQLEEICDYSRYYVQNGLVGLYTVFAGDKTADVLNGTWANRVEGGEDATFKGALYWNKGAEGVGYSMTLATWNASAKEAGIILPASFENLASFTVEAFAAVEGITNADGTRYTNVYTPASTDEEGNEIPASGRQYGYYKAGMSTFRFGIMNTLFFASLDKNAQQSLAQRWYLSNSGYPDGAYKSPMENISPAGLDQSWRLMGPESVPTAGVMQVTKSTTLTDVTYQVAYDASATPVVDATITAERYAELAAGTKSNDSSAYFSLFNGLPATVYAIRVYNRVLTQAEKEQNVFVDKAAFYRIDLTGFEDLSEDTQNAIKARFATIGTDLDMATVQAIYAFLSGTDNESLAGKVVTFKNYAPILANAYGYRVIFNVNTESLDLFESMGYTVSYGAVVAAGGKYNTAANVTVNTEGAKVVSVGGPYGTNVYYELAGGGGYNYSVAVTATDSALFGADMIVRGYISLTDAEGDTDYVYVDVAENEVLDGEVSILTAADYFVNRFDGNVATQYKYMNAAALREILAECGVPGRVALEDDLTLFVEANGSDGNDGLTKDAAYATLAAALDAAKAHLAKPGVKNVVIKLGAGEFSVTETLALTADEILADEYSFKVVGEGEDTVVNALTAIDNASVDYTDDFGAAYVQLPADENGEYPAFRAVYGDGEMLTLSHEGDKDNELGAIKRLYFLDADDNVLADYEDAEGNVVHIYDYNTTTGVAKNDWALTSLGASLAKTAVFVLPADALSLDASAYAGAELHFTQAWTYAVSVINKIEIDGDEAHAYVTFGNMSQSMYSGYNVKGQYFWFENGYGLLEANTDTYYYDQANGVLYYYEENSYLSDMTVEYSPVEQIFAFRDVNNITFEGITFTGLDNKLAAEKVGYGFGQAGSSSVYKAGQTRQSVGFTQSAAIFANNVNGLTVKNVTVENVLSAGIVTKGVSENVTIDSSIFRNIGDAAIRIGNSAYSGTTYTKNLTITNNYVTNTGTFDKASCAVQSFAVANAKIIGNTVIDVPYSAFSFGWIWSTVGSSVDDIIYGAAFSTFNMEIAYNYVTDCMTCTGDGGPFYLLGGNIKRAADDKTAYNYMHHNYVNMSEATGLRGNNATSRRFAMGYYHDNSSSNWIDYENVLINTSSGTFNAWYLQHIEDCESQNNVLINNYHIGVSKTAGQYNMNEVYTNGSVINADFGVVANDYVYENVNALKNNTSIGVVTYANATTKVSPANASTTVAGIFAACGSTLAPDGVEISGLNWTAAPVDRVVLMDAEIANIDGMDVETHTVTFTDGERTVVAQGVAGVKVAVPAIFAEVGYDYEFTVGGEAIDPTAIVIGDTDVTVNVKVTVKEYSLTVKDGLQTVTITLPYGTLVSEVIPESFFQTGYTSTFTTDGNVIDLATYTMPAEDVELRVTYALEKHMVTFVDKNGVTHEFYGNYGANVPMPTTKFTAPFGHTTKYFVDDVEIKSLTVPNDDLTVEVRYVPNTYQVHFVNKIGETETHYATVDVVFGTAITLPEAPASFEDAGYLYTFAGWIGYTEGMILEAETMTFYTDWTAEEITDEPELALGDIDGNGVVDITDIVAVINIASGAVNEYPGNPDVDGSGVVDITDIVTVINIASGSAS